MWQKILKNGNSLAMTIPSRLVKTFGLRPGQAASVKVDLPRARLTIIFPNPGQLSLLPKK